MLRGVDWLKVTERSEELSASFFSAEDYVYESVLFLRAVKNTGLRFLGRT